MRLPESGGHMEVNVDLFEKVEALGEIREQRRHLEWTEGALALLQQKSRSLRRSRWIL